MCVARGRAAARSLSKHSGLTGTPARGWPQPRDITSRFVRVPPARFASAVGASGSSRSVEWVCASCERPSAMHARKAKNLCAPFWSSIYRPLAPPRQPLACPGTVAPSAGGLPASTLRARCSSSRPPTASSRSSSASLLPALGRPAPVARSRQSSDRGHSECARRRSVRQGCAVVVRRKGGAEALRAILVA